MKQDGYEIVSDVVNEKVRLGKSIGKSLNKQADYQVNTAKRLFKMDAGKGTQGRIARSGKHLDLIKKARRNPITRITGG